MHEQEDDTFGPDKQITDDIPKLLKSKKLKHFSYNDNNGNNRLKVLMTLKN